MMSELTAARAQRLLGATDILESCQLMGERADIETVLEALLAAHETIGPEPEQARALTEEEIRILCGISTLLKALGDMAALWAQRMQPGRIQRKLLQLRESVQTDVLMPRFERLSEKQRNEFLVRSNYWSYMIIEPMHQLALMRLMERAAAGKVPTKLQRENAAVFLRVMQGWMPLARPKPQGMDTFDPTADPAVDDL